MNKFHALAISAAIGLALTTSASATTYTYDFGQELAGNGPASLNFATLVFDTITDIFTLNVKKSFSTFGDDAFIGSLALDYSGAKPTVGSITGGGVHSIDTQKSNGPTGVFDYRFNFGNDEEDRLKAGETISWKSGNFLFGDLGQANFALHVQGIDNHCNEESSGWYKVSPVPEPETYAMMLAGLGLIGWTARRRKSKV